MPYISLVNTFSFTSSREASSRLAKIISLFCLKDSSELTTSQSNMELKLTRGSYRRIVIVLSNSLRACITSTIEDSLKLSEYFFMARRYMPITFLSKDAT